MSISQTFPSYQAASGWNALLEHRAPHLQAPTANRFDVVVVGAGVTGLAAARRIAEIEPRSRVLLIDASSIGEGSSGRKSGFLITLPHHTGMAGHGSPLEVARKQIALYEQGLSWIKGLIDRHGIECGWNHTGKFHAAATAEGEANLRGNLAQYAQWGVQYRELNRSELEAELGTRYYRYGYHSDNNVFVQPAALVRGLADSLPANVFLWEGEPVLSIEKGKPHRIVTKTMQLTAPRIVITNNGFARKLGFARDRVFTIYTYAALTPQLDANELGQLGPGKEWGVIPANRLGTTLRKVATGRFMVRSAYSYEREQPMSQVRALLTESYRRRYPDMRDHAFEYVWGGVTALTRNGALYFGQVDEGLFISIGCNGAGMLKGSMFGKLLGEMACGEQSPQLADALGFERPTWLPPEPIRKLAVVGSILYQKRKAGLER